MTPLLRNSALVIVTAAVTFGLTATIYKRYLIREVIAMTVAEGSKIEAFNDVGRLENYDSLSDLLSRNCLKEAVQFVQVQQSLLLAGIEYQIRESEAVGKVVVDRNAAVAERARTEAKNRSSPRELPRCQ